MEPIIKDLSEHLFAVAQLIEVEEVKEKKKKPSYGSFRARAFKNVARTLTTTNVDLQGKIPGAGSSVQEVINDFIKTGTSTRYQALAAQFPVGMLDLTRVQGIGPATAHKLWEQGMRSLQDLKDNLHLLKPKIQEALRETMEKSVGERMPRVEAEAMAAPLLAKLRNHPLVEEAIMTGSARREKETCKDVDVVVLVSEENHEEFWDFEQFRQLGKMAKEINDPHSASRIVNFGSHRGSLYVENEKRGMNIDIWCANPWNFGAHVLYTTGSKGFNIWMRQQAVEQGYTLNDWGVFPASTKETKDYTKENQLSGRTEKEIFEFLNLDWVEPKDREKAVE